MRFELVKESEYERLKLRITENATPKSSYGLIIADYYLTEAELKQIRNELVK